MSHPDFRVGGRIFATLAADGSYGVVMLDAEQQRTFVDADATAFIPAAGAWGLRGCTKVMLRAARAPAVRAALDLAWKNISAKAKKPLRTQARRRR